LSSTRSLLKIRDARGARVGPKRRLRVDDDDDDDGDAKKENRREKKKKATQEKGEEKVVPDWKKVLTRFFPSEGRRETTEAL